MRTIFLADAHLVADDDPNCLMLLRFLRELKGNTEALFIMGDLFDFWLGFPANPSGQFNEVLAALQSLGEGGCRLVYFEGNHDFHLGPVFRQRLQAEVHTGPAILSLQGRRLFLCHGDQINRRDYSYRILRLLLHNRLTGFSLRLVPPAVALSVRERLQSASRSAYEAKSRRWDYREIVRSFGRRVREQGCDGLVTGHFHLAYREELEAPPFTILSLGDWMEQFTYGELAEGELHLRTYQAG